MNVNKHLLNVVVAAVVAAVTAIGTSYLIFRYTPLGLTQSVSIDQQRLERIIRDYLAKNPQILVEMTTELDKRQAIEDAPTNKGYLRQFRSHLSVAGVPRSGKS